MYFVHNLLLYVANLSIVGGKNAIPTASKMVGFIFISSFKVTLDSPSATTLLTPARCYATIEQFNSSNSLFKLVNLCLTVSLFEKFFSMACTTTVLSLNSLMKVFLTYLLNKLTALMTASNSRSNAHYRDSYSENIPRDSRVAVAVLAVGVDSMYAPHA